jgi:hypothetical protein
MTSQAKVGRTMVFGAVVVILLSCLTATCAGQRPGSCPKGVCPTAPPIGWRRVVVDDHPRLQRLRELDSLLVSIQQLRERVDEPSLVLPGPSETNLAEGKLSVAEYERAVRRIFAQWQVGSQTWAGNRFLLERFDQRIPPPLPRDGWSYDSQKGCWVHRWGPSAELAPIAKEPAK